MKSGVLAERDGHRVFVQNYAFKSPSAAASVVCGRPAAGTVEWKTADTGITYKQWEGAQLGQTAESP